MFTKPPAAKAPVAQPKPTSVGEVKKPAAAKPSPKATKPAAPKVPSKGETPKKSSLLVNELYGDAGLPDVPPTTPYEIELAHSYWDKQYAQAESGTQMLYPHTHESRPTDMGHHNYFLD